MRDNFFSNYFFCHFDSRLDYFLSNDIDSFDDLSFLDCWDNLLYDHFNFLVNWGFNVSYDFNFHDLLLDDWDIHFFNDLVNFLHLYDSIDYSLDYLRYLNDLFHNSWDDDNFFNYFLYFNYFWNFN
jgi:hypothetical protein